MIKRYKEYHKVFEAIGDETIHMFDLYKKHITKEECPNSEHKNDHYGEVCDICNETGYLSDIQAIVDELNRMTFGKEIMVTNDPNEDGETVIDWTTGQFIVERDTTSGSHIEYDGVYFNNDNDGGPEPEKIYFTDIINVREVETTGREKELSEIKDRALAARKEIEEMVKKPKKETYRYIYLLDVLKKYKDKECKRCKGKGVVGKKDPYVCSGCEGVGYQSKIKDVAEELNEKIKDKSFQVEILSDNLIDEGAIKGKSNKDYENYYYDGNPFGQQFNSENNFKKNWCSGIFLDKKIKSGAPNLILSIEKWEDNGHGEEFSVGEWIEHLLPTDRLKIRNKKIEIKPPEKLNIYKKTDDWWFSAKGKKEQ